MVILNFFWIFCSSFSLDSCAHIPFVVFHFLLIFSLALSWLFSICPSAAYWLLRGSTLQLDFYLAMHTRSVMGTKVLWLKQKSYCLWLPRETWSTATGPWITLCSDRRGAKPGLSQQQWEPVSTARPACKFAILAPSTDPRVAPMEQRNSLFFQLYIHHLSCILYLCSLSLDSICSTLQTYSTASLALHPGGANC